MFPCNVIIQEMEDGEVEIANQVREKLRRVVENV
jgi:uncharacterized protein (DUF302 family)